MKNNQPLHDYHSSSDQANRRLIHIAHANGFPPEVYTEMVTHLGDTYRVVALPARPLWEPAPPAENFTDWSDMADDLIAGLEAYHLKPVIGIGHSMGGTTTLMACVKRPDLFRALIMLDPVLFPRNIIRLLTLGPFPKPKFPLVQQALRRRRQWESREEAFERFHGRAIFKNWSDAMLWAYIDGLTKPTNGAVSGIELRYTPEWEARIYELAPRSVRGWWDWLKQITVPTIVIQGAATDTFVQGAVNLWKKTRPDFQVISIPNAGHLFPIDQPTTSAEHILAFLKGLS